jgi:spore cortex biosynthesis protein YabQ
VEGLNWQIRTVLASLAAGMLMGALYDLCAFFARVFRMQKGAMALVDLFYWLLSSAMTFSILMRVSRGEVRVYVLAGVAIGFWVYTLTGRLLAAPVFTIIEWTARRIFRSLRRAWNWARRPVSRTNRQISGVLMKGFSSTRRKLSQAAKFRRGTEDASEKRGRAAREVNE